ncbi:MAG: hypothetical protein WC761_00405 [Candidatus Paceibacterota bacterium]|jgi:hypothetical protein
MSNLREELLKYKERQQQIVDEAAVSWVEKNIILISERLNRSAISRLTNSIARFDEKFGPFKEKLPTIQSILDDAEMGLQMVLTGKTSDSRATDMLRNLSLVYSLLSDFFSGDLPALLRTPILRAAKENPDVRLDSLSGPKYDPAIVASALANALRPSKDELKMLGKVYKNIPLPNLKSDEISKQLLSLSYNELMRLTEVGKVPMVAIAPEGMGKAEEKSSSPSSQGVGTAGATEQMAPPATAPIGQSAAAPKPNTTAGLTNDTPMSNFLTPSPLPPQGEVAPQPGLGKQEPELPKDEGAPLKEDLLEEAAPDLAAIGKALGDLEGLFAKVPDLKASPLYGAVSNLRKQAQAAATGQAQGRIMSLLTGGGGIGALAKDPAGRIITQAQMAIDMFKKLGVAWPKIAGLFADGEFDAEEQKQLTAILTKELQGGLFKQFKDAFGVQPFPGLTVTDIIRVVADLAAKDATPPQQATAEQGAVPLTEGIEDIKKFFTDLNTSFKPQASVLDRAMSRGAGGGTAAGGGRAGAASGQTTGRPSPTTGGRPGQPAQGQQTFGSGQQSTAPQAPQTGPIELSPDTSDEQLALLTKKIGVEPDRLRKLIQTRGIRLTVDPRLLQVK